MGQDRRSSSAKNATTGPDGKTYQVDFFNLDVIISIGYRVNSKRGVQFRQWATEVLRDFLIKGYSLNQNRLTRKTLEEAQTAIDILSKTLNANALLTEKGRAVLDVVNCYAGAWRLLLDYDEGRLSAAPRRPVTPPDLFSIEDVRVMAAALRTRLAATGEAGALFGQERGKALEGIIASLDQTFGGQPLYPSAQARAAHLLYFVIKNTRSAAETNGSRPCSSWNTSAGAAYCWRGTGNPVLRGTPWWPWPFSSPKALPNRKKRWSASSSTSWRTSDSKSFLDSAPDNFLPG